MDVKEIKRSLNEDEKIIKDICKRFDITCDNISQDFSFPEVGSPEEILKLPNLNLTSSPLI